MTKRYTGGVVSSSLPTVNSAGASGVFLLSQQADYQSRNSWPPFKVEESLRFRASATGYLNKTFAAAGNRKIWTWSGWVKRGTLSTNQGLFACWIGAGSTRMWFGFLTSTNQITFYGQNGGSTIFDLQTTPVYRDPSAWYHLVLAVDTTQSTSSNRAKIYVNGVQVTAFSTSTYASQNTDTAINSADAHYLGSEVTTSTVFDGYMSEVNFVDGQALTPSAFGATDKDGNWSPIAYTGTYGTNGFYVNFRDNTSATTVGYDYSGNGNNWTLNNFNVSTANTSYDIMIDVPEDQSDGTANNRGNYATLNPLMLGSSTLSDGSLRFAGPSSGNAIVPSTIGVSSGKWYWETRLFSTSNKGTIGVIGDVTNADLSTDGYSNIRAYALDCETSPPRLKTNSTTTNASYGTQPSATTDVVMMALDMDNGTMFYGLNGTWFDSSNPATNTNPAFSGLKANATNYFPYCGDQWGSASSQWTINFGQQRFAYTPPSGFKALNTFNLPEPTIKQPNQYFDVSLWTGNATNRAITNAGGFQPDFVWIKHRSSAENHNLYDGIRGPGNRLESNSNAVDFYYSDRLTAFNSNGFNLGTGYNNTNGTTYVGWQWKGSSANTTNTSGSITSIVRANPTSGFSVVTYTATAADPITVGHGLGVAPSMFMVKSRSASGTDWFVYHSSLGATKNLRLNTTAAAATATNVWNDTAPTSSVITTSNAINTNGVTYVAYCFAQVAGYSAFGSYTGNGSTDGPFVYTGFRPKWILMKSTTETGLQWSLWDSSRIGYNPSNYFLAPQSSAAEDTTNSGSNSNGGPDFLSNGFKMRSNGGSHNSSGATYIYMAFAEAPFKYSRSR